MVGDFDFKDSNDENSIGRHPKFAYGMKHDIKNGNADVPGPGAYETDTHPTNQKNTAYWIGTDVRKDLGQTGD
jgi:hypothetical protein